VVRGDGRQPRRRHRHPLRGLRRRAPGLTDYIKGRQGYDYNEHGQAGNTHADFVPDEIVDRFCIIGPPEEHIRRLEELKALGVDQFAVYLQHDDKDHTLAQYGEKVIPAVQEHLKAKE
jgi:alkanesulfonate monooxygenase SsuD/methylene tetrahydromethanopterin reductase-like flavin-dependent oxidoreductase (luciferase family)